MVIKEPAEGELIEGMLRVLPVWGAEHVQGSGAVPAVTPCTGAALLLDRVKVGRVHWVGNLGPVGGRLLPQVAGEVHLGEERVSLYLTCAVCTQSILSRAAEATNDINSLGAQFDLGRHLQCALPVYDLQQGDSNF